MSTEQRPEEQAGQEPRTTLTDGSPVTQDHREIDPATGQQKGYVVLSAEERAKGFVRPVRRSYVHVGPRPPQFPLRDLTDDERRHHGGHGYVKFEAYPPSHAPATGRYWTQAALDRAGKGCGQVTTMGISIAETYAREPSFYGGTFCAHCGSHFPVGAKGEFVWLGSEERVGT